MVVYFAKMEGRNAPYKIGFSGDETLRLKALASKHGSNIELVTVLEGGRDLEKFLHILLKDSHRGNEWFYDTDDVKRVIACAIKATSTATMVKIEKRESGVTPDVEKARDLILKAFKLCPNVTSRFEIITKWLLPQLKKLDGRWHSRRLRSIYHREIKSVPSWAMDSLRQTIDELERDTNKLEAAE